MSSSLKVLKSMKDPDGRSAYHIVEFPSSVKGNILHIKESLWLYRAIAFLCNIIWLEGFESSLKYFTLDCMNLFAGSSHTRFLKRGSPL